MEIKKVIIHSVFLILFFVSNVFSVNWVRKTTPVNALLYKCSFTDSIYGWAAGEDGKIIKTTNSGENWVLQNSPVDFFIYDIIFINRNTGWAVANDNLVSGTAVLKTTNSGLNWTFYRFPDTTTVFYSITFKDTLNGFMAGYGGRIVKSSDGRSNWINCPVDSSQFAFYPVEKIEICSNGLIFGVGGTIDLAGVIWRSTNSGNNFSASAESIEPFYDLLVQNNNEFIACGGDFDFGVMVAKTTNAGNNWVYEPLNAFGIAKGIDNRTQNEIWMVTGYSQKFIVSTNTGLIWYSEPVPEGESLYDICFTDSFHGFAVGTNGSVYKYNIAAIGIGNNQHNVPNTNMLFQNYPNPFNPVTIIEYSITKPSEVKIIIYDITGREIKIIFDGFKPAGTYKIKFDSFGLSSGMYFYRLETGDYYESKKMVIVK